MRLVLMSVWFNQLLFLLLLLSTINSSMCLNLLLDLCVPSLDKECLYLLKIVIQFLCEKFQRSEQTFIGSRLILNILLELKLF
jgi:hypothetical protein